MQTTTQNTITLTLTIDEAAVVYNALRQQHSEYKILPGAQEQTQAETLADALFLDIRRAECER